MFTWHGIPFARLLLPFATGIITTLCFPVFPLYTAVILCMAITGMLAVEFYEKGKFLAFRYRQLQGVGITLIFLCLGILRTWYASDLKQPGHFSSVPHARALQVCVAEPFAVKPNVYKAPVYVTGVWDSAGAWHSTRGKLLLYLRKDSAMILPHVGDTILMPALARDVPGPENPGEFDYRRYLGYHNLFHQAFCNKEQWQLKPLSGFQITRWAENIRSKTLSILASAIRGRQERGVAEALLLGYQDNLDPELTVAFSHTGTLHVLAVSGMHAGIIYLVLQFLTSFLKRRKNGRIIQAVIILLGLWCYILITGFSASMLRAGFMFTLMALGKLFARQHNTYNIIYASAFLLVLFNPFYLVNAGFQLSYAAVLGIVYIQPSVSRWYTPPNRPVKLLWDMLTVSFAAQVLTFPLGIYYFYQFPNAFLLSNLVVIPLTTFALFAAMALLILYGVPVIGDLLAQLVTFLIRLNNTVIRVMDSWHFSYTDGLYLTLTETVLLFVVVLGVASYFIYCRNRFLHLGLAACVLLLVMINIRSYRHAGQYELVQHHVRKHTAVTCFNGHTAYLMADSSFTADKKAFEYHLLPCYNSKGVNVVIILALPEDCYKSLSR